MIALWLSMAGAPALGATCSCAGVPLLSSMEFGTPDNKSWFLSSSYEFHDISDLVSGGFSQIELCRTSRIVRESWTKNSIPFSNYG